MTELREALRLSVDEVTARCPPQSLPFETTDDVAPIDAVFGQERAVRAIEFSLGMDARGYNLFASGPNGFGKTTIVQTFLRRRAAESPAPMDWIYVHNFDDPDRPTGISLPAGRGHAFAEDMRRAVEAAGRELAAAFESDSYARQRRELGEEVERERSEAFQALQTRAQEMGFALQMTSSGIASSPVRDGEPLSEDDFKQLPEEERNRIQEQRRELEREVQEALLKVRATERELEERSTTLDEEVAAFAINHLFQPLIEQYGPDEAIVRFLEQVRDDIQRERDRFRGDGQQQQQNPFAALQQQRQGPPTQRYEVNVLVGNEPDRGAPVIRETHPTYYNLLGRIDYQGQMGAMVTDHTMIRAGSLARSNGGFILLRLRDLLTNPGTLDGLKRALTSEQLEIENIAQAYSLVPTTGLRPEPIPLNVKVVIVGEPQLYSLLYRLDPDFRELFRVKADFEPDFERNEQNTIGLSSVVRYQCETSGLRCFSSHAIARLVEQSSRMVGDQRKLSADMAAFLDLVRQADYWAGEAGADQVDERHVERALEERIYRSSLVRDRLQEAIERGDIYVTTEGQQVGQINALSVYDLGDIFFGRPSRITCVTSPGRGAIVMVERESDMAGRIHNKGFLILRGFLTNRFGQDKANSLHASLTFEQLYGDIDGDSASSTELYALLSSLSEQPIDQGIAVTGSVDQYGRVQPVGGTTAKVEGFFEVCRARGLNGSQGVIIPKTNVDNTILRPEVAQAVEDGRFHVWGVETIEEGIEILTGIPAGNGRGGEGRYAEGTIYRMVEDRLADFYRQLRERPPQQPEGLQHVTPPPMPQPPPPPGVPPEPPPEPPVIV